MSTIVSKAADFNMSTEVVEVKSEVESSREQIQNIEYGSGGHTWFKQSWSISDSGI